MFERIKNLIYSVRNNLRTKTVSDEYLDWLCFANAGMMTRGNLYAMRHAIENLPSSKPVLEIGSFCGLSTNAISYFLLAQGKKNRIFSSDKWIFEGAETGGNLGGSQIPHQDYRNFVKSSFMKNVEFFSPNNKPYAIEVFSDEFFSLWKDSESIDDIFGRNIKLGGVSFCFIEGNHTYEFAKRDFDNVDHYLETGGFVLFDDSSDGNPFGLTKLMREIQSNKRYELVMKNPHYLFKKIS